MENPYIPIRARIEKVVAESSTIRSFTLLPETPIAFRTGQFVELTVPGVGEAPFTPSSSQYSAGPLELTVMKVGKVTSALHELGKGQSVGVRGPYGKGYPLEQFRGKEILICGGGVGLAPLRSLLLTLRHDIDLYRSVALRYGSRTPQDILYKNEIQNWREDGKLDVKVTVDHGDSGWRGDVGLVTAILANSVCDPHEAVAVVCGPPIMMKFATFALLDIGFTPKNIYLSMEKNMSCGIGKCGHCRIGSYYACKDGPVFTYEQVEDLREVWE
ncbi:MAG: FAD/NAD(P)-binding protein [Candidatus Aureabacteria bacterium]|nr:FAD/NAD(P)-binding protein [Candidatus Auribacterota bacterium]